MSTAGATSEFSAAALLRAAGLAPEGPVTWGDRVPCAVPGVYVIDDAPNRHAPLDRAVVADWIDRVPSLRLDGRRPSATELSDRLASFWIPGETVVYVGLAGTSIARRTGQFYRTPLGDPRPHAGGHWLKTLATLDRLRIWWAETSDPGGREAALLAAFAGRHGGGLILPFANRQTAQGIRKPHGITGSTRRRDEPESTTAASAAPVSHARTRSTTGGDLIARINAAIQRLACASPGKEIRAVDAAASLDQLGLLRDSAERPGKPLRDLLRRGAIDHAYQEGGRWWILGCAGRPECDAGHRRMTADALAVMAKYGRG